LPVSRVPAGPTPRHPDLGVAPADPVHHQDGLVAVLVEIDDDLLDQQPDEPLLGAGVCSRRIPDQRQIPGQSQQGGGVDLRLFRDIELEGSATSQMTSWGKRRSGVARP
jgi:hypothetical protein